MIRLLPVLTVWLLGATFASCATSQLSSTALLPGVACIDAQGMRGECLCRNELTTVTVTDFLGTARRITTAGVRLDGRCVDPDVAAAFLCSGSSVMSGYFGGSSRFHQRTSPRTFAATDQQYRPLLRLECVDPGGGRHGLTMTWDLWTGRVQRWGHYDNGKASGMWFWVLSEVGSVIEAVQYRDGQRDGPGFEYDWVGSPTGSYCYRQDRVVRAGTRECWHDPDRKLSPVDVRQVVERVEDFNNAVAHEFSVNPSRYDREPDRLVDDRQKAEDSRRFVTDGAQVVAQAGAIARVRGTYFEVEAPTASGTTVEAGRAGIRLADGVVVMLLEPHDPSAARNKDERDELGNMEVVAEGELHAACPVAEGGANPPACISPLLMVVDSAHYEEMFPVRR